ncbi:SpaA isopeptide-forming pilin-related protein, partial [Klebsiella pneumoniae]|uniref:SpaA isopeptide-forming pilin-related protein n=1 Tax=Klebsiella pneumoniae TaxID=573 RepID=UPI003A88A527
EFTVGTDGVITRQVVKPAEEKSEEAQTLRAKVAKAVEALADKLTGNTNTETYTETISNEPIEVVNYKNIEFEKVDANDKTKKLANAEFEVWYKENVDGEYQAYKVTKDGKEVTKTVTSDKDGKISLNVTKPGYY